MNHLDGYNLREHTITCLVIRFVFVRRVTYGTPDVDIIWRQYVKEAAIEIIVKSDSSVEDKNEMGHPRSNQRDRQPTFWELVLSRKNISSLHQLDRSV